HLAYLNRLPSHNSIDDVAARHYDLRLVRAALEVACQPLGPSFGLRRHIGDLKARSATSSSVAPISPW
ncbi:hypothetical protein A2U01_0100779, partial [Trifolium medium]|nr:hypothetical protein [Trifolium medium]